MLAVLLAGVVAAVSLTACQQAAPVKAPPAKKVFLTSPSGQHELLLVPGGALRGLVLFMHGVDSDERQLLTDGGLVPLRDSLLRKGFAIAASDARGNNAGNPASVRDQRELYDDAVAHLGAVGSVDVVGFSMGGLDALLTVAAGEIPRLGSVALLSPATDQLPFLAGRFGTTVRHAFADSAGDDTAAIRRNDPMYVPVTKYRGHRFLFWHSPTDDVVPVDQSRRMVARLRAAGIDAVLRPLDGHHGNLSELHPTDVVNAFVGRG